MPASRRLKESLVGLVPERVVDWYRRKRHGRTWFDPRDRSVEGIFTQIYERSLWGKSDPSERFSSGPGSEEAVARPTIEALHSLIDEHRITSIVDLGCGDFRVGRKLVRPEIQYTGLDVVQPLIAYNRKRFGTSNIEFRHADLITDPVPDAELCLLRQVLQHLSNAQVATILGKCKKYRFVVITEHLPSAETPFTPNLDIEHGIETRVDIGSGLLVDTTPFDVPIARTLCEVTLPNQTRLRTVLVAND